MLPLAELKRKLLSGSSRSVCAAAALLCALSAPAVAADKATTLDGTELLSVPPLTAPPANITVSQISRPQPLVVPALGESTVMGTPIENGRPVVATAPIPLAPTSAQEMPLASAAVAALPAAPPAPVEPLRALAPARKNFARPQASAIAPVSVAAPMAVAAPRKPGMLERWFDDVFGDDEQSEAVAVTAPSLPVADEKIAAPANIAAAPPKNEVFLAPDAVSFTAEKPVQPAALAAVTPQLAAPEKAAKLAAKPEIEMLPPIYLSPANIIVSSTPPVAAMQAAAMEAAKVQPAAAAPVQVAPAVPAEPAPVAPALPNTAADLAAPYGSNFDPAHPREVVTSGWRGERGQTLHQVLENWCNAANVRLYWDTDFDYPLQASVLINDSFENAVRALLDGFAAASPQPTGRLHRQTQIGENVLIVQTRGNRYEK